MTVRIRDFTTTPGPRYRRQGQYSGEEFRERFLEPGLDYAARKGTHLDVDMSGTEFGAPVGFLEEAFGGLVRNRSLEAAAGHLRLIVDSAIEEPEIRRLMLQAEWSAETRRRYAGLVDEAPQPEWGIWDTLMYAADAARAIRWIERHDLAGGWDESGAVYLSSLYEVEGQRYAGFRIHGDEVVRIDERTLPVLYGAVVARCVERTVRKDAWRTAGTEWVSRLRSIDGRRSELVNKADTAVSLWSVDETTGTLEETRINAATRDALWTIAGAAGIVHGWADCSKAAPAAARWTFSTNGRVPAARRRRLQRWAERIAAWHAAWRMLDARAGGASEAPDDYEMFTRRLEQSSGPSGEKVGWRPGGGEPTWWRSAAEVHATALAAVTAAKARTCGWVPWWNERIDADRFRASLAEPDMEPGQLVIEARLAGGTPSEARLIDSPDADRSVEWESPDDGWKGDAERAALQWLAGIAATAARKAVPSRGEDAAGGG